jgi:acetyl esterase/lipase
MSNNQHIRRRALLAVTLALGAFASFLIQPRKVLTAEATYRLERTIGGIEFTPTDWPQPLVADLHLPQRGGPLPVVITVHGGGWAKRNRGDMNAIGKKLVRHGYAVLNVSHRLAPRFTFPAQLHDLEQALDWIVANAERYRLDSERINAWGYSSGAHLVALLASRDSDQPKSRVSSVSPPLRAVVAGGIPADLLKYPDSGIINRFIGGNGNELAPVWADASPVNHVSDDDPPVFLYHGKLDILVGADQSSNYYAALRAGGVDAELYMHNWFGHFGMFLFGGDAEDRAIAFLDRNNTLPTTLPQP